MGNPIVRFEIGCKDLEGTRAFYASLFDWKTTPNIPSVSVDLAPGGLPGALVALGHEPHNYTTVYVEVDDLAATLEKLGALGGKKIVGPVPLPTGTFAWFSDPEGNVLGLWQPKK